MELSTNFQVQQKEFGSVLRKASAAARLKCPTVPPFGVTDTLLMAASRGGLARFHHCRPHINMVSGGLAKGVSYTHDNSKHKVVKRLGSCWVIPPPRGKKPSAIIKFVGGAFIGAVPEVTYNYITEFLANEGFIIISVPYNVSFDHAEGARAVFERFHTCLNTMLATGLPEVNLTADDVVHLPFYSVGHSNGALLEVLAGCYFSEKIPKANVIVSYNNKPATEAVPYFDQLGPLVRQLMPIVEESPFYSVARNASGDVQKLLLDFAEAFMVYNDQESRISLNRFIDQLPSVFDQVRQGISEFKPTPSENQNYFKEAYNVRHTLLVKFNSDVIDETDLLEESLKPRVESIGGTLEKVSLGGNHLTPCIQEPKLAAGELYTPADAVAQGMKAVALSETKALSRTISGWFTSLGNEVDNQE